MGLMAAALVWRGASEEPLVPPGYEHAWEAGTQVLPVAVPAWPAEPLPADPAARLARLRERSVVWREGPAAAPCELYVRVSEHHWGRLPFEPDGPAAARAATLYLPRAAFADDRDEDGDPLDPGELTSGRAGAETELVCR